MITTREISKSSPPRYNEKPIALNAVSAANSTHPRNVRRSLTALSALVTTHPSPAVRVRAFEAEKRLEPCITVCSRMQM
jgi:hypothetical protein